MNPSVNALPDGLNRICSICNIKVGWNMQTELEKKEILRLSNVESNRITKECLQLALVKLMGQKPFDRISITEITKNAGVSRTAFYRNYNSKEAIIEDVCQSVFARLRDSLHDAAQNQNWKSWYILFFTSIRSNREYVQIYLDAHLPLESLVVMDAVFPPDTTLAHYTNSAQEGAFLRILTDWFRGGMQQTPEEMGEICQQILSPIGPGKKE